MRDLIAVHATFNSPWQEASSANSTRMPLKGKSLSLMPSKVPTGDRRNDADYHFQSRSHVRHWSALFYH
jgi:hypothetical protein